MAHGSMGVGASNYAQAADTSTVDAHYVFMALKGCP